MNRQPRLLNGKHIFVFLSLFLLSLVLSSIYYFSRREDSNKEVAIGQEFLDKIIITNEDPYDESPQEIASQIEEEIENKAAKIILDRKKAVAYALRLAQKNDVVIIGLGENSEKARLAALKAVLTLI